MSTSPVDGTCFFARRLDEERITDPVLGNRVITYTYDPVGNRLEKNDNGVITSYTYDNNDRLLSEACPEQCRRGGFSYGYDNTCPELVEGTAICSPRPATANNTISTTTLSGFPHLFAVKRGILEESDLESLCGACCLLA
jgi:YD repeat-containing protein